jgi:crotonobetainyl-CoA:carnitine CoA-transferase CaiB-like acyl-CoA transferase
MTFLDHYRGQGPLRGVTVLDFSQMMMGPVATQLFGDLGAVVLKVERPGRGEWERSYLPQGRRIAEESPYFLAMNRNKLGLAADLKDPDDVAMLHRLVRHVDVVVHNFRPGVMERLGFGYEQLAQINPAIVYAAGSGFGESGPWVERPGQDLLIQATSGLAADSGPAGVPPVPAATPIVDASTGFLMAFHMAAAVLEARETGRGRALRGSLLGTALLMQCQQALVTLNTDLRYQRSDSGLGTPWSDAPYGIYATDDGYLAMAVVTPDLLGRVFSLPPEVAGLSGEDAFEARDAIVEAITPQLAARSTESWIAEMAEHDIWAAPVLTLEEVLHHEQVAANRLVEEIPTPDGGTIQAIGLAVAVSGLDSAARLPAPRVGQHTEEILTALEELETTTEAIR